ASGWNGWVTTSELEALLLPPAVCEGRLDDAGGDRPAAGQGAGVVQVGFLSLQVGQGFPDDLGVLGTGRRPGGSPGGRNTPPPARTDTPAGHEAVDQIAWQQRLLRLGLVSQLVM